MTEVLELRTHGLHFKPVVLLNTAGFYDGFAVQLRRMEAEGFLPVALADDAAGVLGLLERSAGGFPAR